MASKLGKLLQHDEEDVLRSWREAQRASLISDYGTDNDFLEHTSQLFRVISGVVADGQTGELTGGVWDEAREVLRSLSRDWAYQGVGPSETATFVLSLKKPLFQRVRAAYSDDAQRVLDETWRINEIIDKLALFTTESYQQTREEVISRQQRDLLELSTPVVELWQGVVVLPLIGTLDSARTQLVMEALLQKIVDSASTIAIIDITGVPAVDTLVAQHLLKTVAAARLMGAECIISGVSPQIAQTIVHLGVDLSAVSTKASLSSAFALALSHRGLTVCPVDKA